MSGMAHAAEEPDEPTRILQASDVIAASGEVQAMQTARPAVAEEEEERTTILVHENLGEDTDERTTILRAPGHTQGDGGGYGGSTKPSDTPPPGGHAWPGTLPAGAEYLADAEDEPTTILVDAAYEGASEPALRRWEPAAPDWTEQAHHPAPDNGQAFTTPAEPFGGGDEPSVISYGIVAGHDGQAVSLQHDQADVGLHEPGAGPRDEALVFHHQPASLPVEAEPQLRASQPGKPEAGGWTLPQPPDASAEEALPIPPAPEPSDSTQILPAAELAGLADEAGDQDGQVSGRAWFDRRLRDFNHALLHTQTGGRRPAKERQALAAAARDMIQRMGLRDPEHKPSDWTDSVLQPDQLLVNTYFVRALIARGGVGEIYRARHRDLKTEHAIKILLPRYALDPTVLNLMLEEARLLQRVRHEAVVGCQGLLRDTDGRPMLVMDYLRGRTLSARLRQGPLPPPDLIRLAARLASGLSALHAQGLVHQDISPDNIMLVDDNCAAATIIDFGLARSLDAPENTHRNIDFAGKFSWCSPEQLSSRAGHVDARSDLYSLGLVLAAAARGTRLDMGNDLASARAARHSVPPLAGIQEPIATLLRHLLAPSTVTRLRSAEEVPDWLRTKRPGFVQRMFGR